MKHRALGIHGVWLIQSDLHKDNRGYFTEKFKGSYLENEIGVSFNVAQINFSTSAAGVVRGIHWATRPQGQKKLISCMSGLIWDVFVDLRPESPTFGQWASHYLKGGDSDSILIDDGIGHAFLSLEENTAVTYLVSSEYSPEGEKGMNPLDKKLGIDFRNVAKKMGVTNLIFSTKDQAAPDFETCETLGYFDSTYRSFER